MFSGIVKEIGTVLSCYTINDCQVLNIKADKILKNISIGDSIAVNGVCLTVVSFTKMSFTVHAIPETLRLTNLSNLASNSFVNLESAMHYGASIGGHLVQGHIDCTTTISKLNTHGEAINAIFFKPKIWGSCIIPKGFIAIDGMSLTITFVTDNMLGVSFVPHTIATTIVKDYQEGQEVNVEIDCVMKTIATIMQNKGR